MDRVIITRGTQEYHIGNRDCHAFCFANQIHIVYNYSLEITINIDTGDVHLFNNIPSGILRAKIEELVILRNGDIDITSILNDIIYLLDYMEHVILPKIADDLHSHFGKATKSARNI